MKTTFVILSAILISLVLFSCSATKEPVVAKNADLNADFKSLKTYAWTKDIDEIPNDQVFIGPNGVFVFNNQSVRKMIKDAVQYELDAKGYKMDPNSPDMLVSFSVFEQPATLRTTDGYATLSSGEKVRTEDNLAYTDVKPGTLIINFIDAKKNKQIWQGFASGILKAGQVKDESKVRHAVSRIISEFNYNSV
jgi:hypothetical protein